MIRTAIRACALLAVAAPGLLAQGGGGRTVSPVVLMLILGTISLAPFLALMLTSFVKVSIVLSIVKSALGTQVPPGQVTNGLAIVLTIFIMAPVGQRMYEASGIKDPGAGVFTTDNLVSIYNAADKGKEPLRAFLLKHAHSADRALFVSLAQRLNQGGRANAGVDVPEAVRPPLAQPETGAVRPDEEFSVVLPAFVTSELKGAFQIGFLVLLSFLVIDIVIANVLVAAGLNMIQPAVVSLPLKILLFVVADGWYLLVKGLVLGYA